VGLRLAGVDASVVLTRRLGIARHGPGVMVWASRGCGDHAET